MEVELRHLRAVCAVADAGSVSKAAAALGISQPALTAQLRRIEQSLGGAPAGCETKVSDGFSTPFNLWENVGDAPTVSGAVVTVTTGAGDTHVDDAGEIGPV